MILIFVYIDWSALYSRMFVVNLRFYRYLPALSYIHIQSDSKRLSSMAKFYTQNFTNFNFLKLKKKSQPLTRHTDTILKFFWFRLKVTSYVYQISFQSHFFYEIKKLYLWSKFHEFQLFKIKKKITRSLTSVKMSYKFISKHKKGTSIRVPNFNLISHRVSWWKIKIFRKNFV